jgi:hypothetical protein
MIYRITVFAAAALAFNSLAEDISYNHEVRPILSKYCFSCHGPDEHGRKADLRLDTYAGAIEDHDGVKAVNPANLAASELIARIITDDPDEIMPPPKSKKVLNKDEIRIITEWVKAGAKYESHWAFVSPKKATVPKSKWAKNPIDAFVERKMQKKKLKPQAQAAKARQLRRVTFDLTGLPPTPEELDAFLADKSADAYEKAVDRLLASPHYGERMAIAWMDAARYGDSSVMHADGPRTMWPWRDWVINAYNTNKPFNDFALEQLAGDLIPEATNAQKLATGFNRNHPTSDEGGAFAEELRVEYIVDRIKTTGNVFMGLSVECGQCHDHKFDPITQVEYYQMFAFFNNNADPGMQTRRGNQAPVVKVESQQREEALAGVRAEKAAHDKKIAEHIKGAQGAITAWVSEQEAKLADGDLENPMPAGLIGHIALDDSKDFAESLSGTKGKLRGKYGKADRDGNTALNLNGKTAIDYADLGSTYEFNTPFTLAAWVKMSNKAGGSVLARMDVGNAYRGFDLWLQSGAVGTHVINTWPDNAVKVVSKGKIKNNKWTHIAVTYDGSGKAAGCKVYIDGKVSPHNVEQDDLTATIKTKVPFRIGARSAGANSKGGVDDVRMYERALTAAEIVRIQSGGNALKELLAVPADKRNDAQKKALADHYLNSSDKAYQALKKELAGLNKKEADIAKKYPEVDSMIMADNATNKMRKTYVLDRGHYDSPRKDKEILPEVPEFLPPLPPGSPANRLGLAQWLTAPNHPLTARVTVNRYWSMLFGSGIVESVMDFGNQGAPPTHPELLDWLAVDFAENGWDIKRTIRMMVTSNTYRQSTKVTPALLEADPLNRLLSRGARFRLQGEFIRDHALSVGGLLINEVGGASVKPYQPDGIWNEVSLNGGLRYKRDNGEKLYRRSMYTYWKRSAPAPNMMIFDAPTRETCVVQRARTNTPLQALVTLNDVHFVEASRQFAERVMKGGDTFEKRMELAYKLALSRTPGAKEIAVCKRVYETQLASFKAKAGEAEKYLKSGDSPRDTALEVNEHAAFTVLMNMLLNLDESLTRG